MNRRAVSVPDWNASMLEIGDGLYDYGWPELGPDHARRGAEVLGERLGSV